jgi:tetratricopeptide (TPR) repeat protein
MKNNRQGCRGANRVREDFAMRRAWLLNFGAALCVAASVSEPAPASPASLTRGQRPATESSASWSNKLTFWKSESGVSTRPIAAAQDRPTDEISAWRHPIKYFSAAMGETPIASTIKKNNDKITNPTNDSIGLSTPTGPATPEFHISLAQVAERQGNVPQARTQLQEGLKKWPTNVELLRAAARMEDRQNNLVLAEKLYRKAVTSNPQHAGALNDLGLCLARQGKLQESVQSFEQAINLQPTKPLYRNNAATVLVEMKEDQRALAHLSTVHGAAESNYNLGQLLVDRGRPHEAITYFGRALELDPSMQQAQLAISQLNGTPMPTAQFASEPTKPQQAVTPAYGPQFAPQQPVSEPTFPATARGPAYGQSSYVPPANYYPSAPQHPAAMQYPSSQLPAPQAPTYQTAEVPRYLPPVQQPANGTMVR